MNWLEIRNFTGLRFSSARACFLSFSCSSSCCSICRISVISLSNMILLLQPSGSWLRLGVYWQSKENCGVTGNKLFGWICLLFFRIVRKVHHFKKKECKLTIFDVSTSPFPFSSLPCYLFLLCNSGHWDKCLVLQ